MNEQGRRIRNAPLTWLAISLGAIAIYTLIGPAEKTLGTNVRVVYLHGAWVWASLASFFTAGVAGIVGLVTSQQSSHRWSRALGRTGLLFWITYLPISLWAMQTNWNGLFLSEPRWRMVIVFAVTGLLMQIGLTLLENPVWASIINLSYLVALITVLSLTENVMHPPSPMIESNAWRIQLFFGGLTLLTLIAAWQVARLWHQFEWVKNR